MSLRRFFNVVFWCYRGRLRDQVGLLCARRQNSQRSEVPLSFNRCWARPLRLLFLARKWLFCEWEGCSCHHGCRTWWRKRTAGNDMKCVLKALSWSSLCVLSCLCLPSCLPSSLVFSSVSQYLLLAVLSFFYFFWLVSFTSMLSLQVRVVQGKETPVFLNLFKGGMIIHTGRYTVCEHLVLISQQYLIISNIWSWAKICSSDCLLGGKKITLAASLFTEEYKLTRKRENYPRWGDEGSILGWISYLS